jgi:hypothetical protein
MNSVKRNKIFIDIVNSFAPILFVWSIFSAQPKSWWLYYIASVVMVILGMNTSYTLEFHKRYKKDSHSVGRMSLFPHNTITYWIILWLPFLILSILLIMFVPNFIDYMYFSFIIGVFYILIENLFSSKGTPILKPNASSRYSFDLWDHNSVKSYIFDVFIISISIMIFLL